MARTLLALLGDTHFGQEDPVVMAALRADLHAAMPAHIVVAGDLTQRARHEEFRRAREFLAELPAPVLAVPGNHDLPLYDLRARLLHPYRRWRHYIHPEREPTLHTPELAIVGVDATHPLRHEQGDLGARRIRASARRVGAVQARFRVVVVHQPVAVLEQADRRKLARGHENAVGAWIHAGADLVLGGHVHRGYCMLTGPAPRAVVVQAGTAISHRRRHGEPNSYFRIELEVDADGHRHMCIQRRDFDAQRACFGDGPRHLARRHEDGWRLR